MIVKFTILTAEKKTSKAGTEPTYTEALEAVEQHIEQKDLATLDIISIKLHLVK